MGFYAWYLLGVFLSLIAGILITKHEMSKDEDEVIEFNLKEILIFIVLILSSWLGFIFEMWFAIDEYGKDIKIKINNKK